MDIKADPVSCRGVAHPQRNTPIQEPNGVSSLDGPAAFDVVAQVSAEAQRDMHAERMEGVSGSILIVPRRQKIGCSYGLQVRGLPERTPAAS